MDEEDTLAEVVSADQELSAVCKITAGSHPSSVDAKMADSKTEEVPEDSSVVPVFYVLYDGKKRALSKFKKETTLREIKQAIVKETDNSKVCKDQP